jgi:hypothetical protein
MHYGKEIINSKSKARTQILNPSLYAVFPLRAAEIGLPQIRALPYLFSRTGFKG